MTLTDRRVTREDVDEARAALEAGEEAVVEYLTKPGVITEPFDADAFRNHLASVENETTWGWPLDQNGHKHDCPQYGITTVSTHGCNCGAWANG